MSNDNTTCPKCNSELSPVTTTQSGKKLQKCSKGFWNPETHKNEGCDYVKWFEPEPELLDEDCPKCGQKLVLMSTKFGKKMKKCSTSGWDRDARQATGCDYIEWLNGSREELEEKCPMCQSNLVFVTTSNGKKMKKCSTSGWDRFKKVATGCSYISWVNDKDDKKSLAKSKPAKASKEKSSSDVLDLNDDDFNLDL